MKRHLWLATLLLSTAVTPALAADPAVSDPFNWSGFYAGGHVGAGFESSKLSNPAASSSTPFTFGDRIGAGASELGVQGGYNWQVPHTNWVVGLEADLGLVQASGANTCLSQDTFSTSANCQVHTRYSGSIAPRVGYALGDDNRLLPFAKLGYGIVGIDQSITANSPVRLPESTKNYGDSALLTGVGVEYALTPRISARLEYDHYFLNSFGWVGPAIGAAYYPGKTTNSFDTVKLGVDYHFGPTGTWAPVATKKAALDTGWSIESGLRYWYSTGRFQKNLADANISSSTLVSRLTYTGSGNAGELFARAENPTNIFIKGNVGLGGLSKGHLNDEDWGLPGVTPPLVPYSNTLSSSTGSLDYGNIDVGYDFLRTGGAKLGGFIGYSYIYEQHNALGCVQQTTDTNYCAAGRIASNTPAITETDRWNSLRLGVSGELPIYDQLKLTTDLAFLPVAGFHGTDNHWARALTITEHAIGEGVQADIGVQYKIADRFNVGTGLRYWSLWADKGADAFNGISTARNVSYHTDRFGAFLSASYELDGPAPARSH